MQKPILEELEKKYGDKVDFKVVDVDENQEMASKYGIHAVPTLIIQKDGAEVKRFMQSLRFVKKALKLISLITTPKLYLQTLIHQTSSFLNLLLLSML